MSNVHGYGTTILCPKEKCGEKSASNGHLNKHYIISQAKEKLFQWEYCLKGQQI